MTSTFDLDRVPDSPKDSVCTKFGQNTLKDVDSSVHKDVTEGQKEGRTDGSVTISHCNFVGEGIITN